MCWALSHQLRKAYFYALRINMASPGRENTGYTRIPNADKSLEQDKLVAEDIRQKSWIPLEPMLDKRLAEDTDSSPEVATRGRDIPEGPKKPNNNHGTKNPSRDENDKENDDDEGKHRGGRGSREPDNRDPSRGGGGVDSGRDGYLGPRQPYGPYWPDANFPWWAKERMYPPYITAVPQATGPGGIDLNMYATKKTMALGLLDLSTFSANVAQLRTVLKQGAEFQDYYYFMVSILILSMLLQLVVAGLLMYVVRYDIKTEKYQKRCDFWSNMTTFLIVLITVINLTITGFMMDVKAEKVIACTYGQQMLEANTGGSSVVNIAEKLRQAPNTSLN